MHIIIRQDDFITHFRKVMHQFTQCLHQVDIRRINLIDYENCCRQQLFSRNLYTSSGDNKTDENSLLSIVSSGERQESKTLGEIVSSQLRRRQIK
jgi:hypothetical protein